MSGQSFSGKRAALYEQLLAEQGLAASGRTRVPKRAQDGFAPLSFAQERLWFLDQLEPGSPFYNIPAAFRVQAPLDGRALAAALREVARRHEVLRTTFSQVDGSPVQVVAPRLELEVPVVDLSGLDAGARQAEADRLAGVEAARPFDLGTGPLLRATVLRLAPADHVVLLTVHHIVADGWSMGVLFAELGVCYQAAATGQAAVLPELPLQYGDFADWQRRYLSGERLETHLRWWREHLRGAPGVLELPADHPRPPVQAHRGSALPLRLSPALTRRLKALGGAQGATLFMTLLTGFAVLCSRYCGAEDLVIGVPIANRTRAELEGLIGFFINTLPVRVDLRGNPSFAQALDRVREAALGAYAHQDLPFERLVQELQPQRDPSRNPLFQVMFTLQQQNSAQARPSGGSSWVPPAGTGTAKFDLTLYTEETAGGIHGSIEYRIDLFDPDRITRMAEHLRVLLEAAAAAPDTTLAALPLLPPEERDLVVQGWNATKAPPPPVPLVHRLVARQARRTPRAPAVTFGQEVVAYGPLLARARALAQILRGLGVRPEQVVGIMAERSPAVVTALLGILFAGGAYLPLDPDYPPDRLAYMLSDSGAALVLCAQDLTTRLPPFTGQVLVLEEALNSPATKPSTTLPDPHPDNLAYVMYTSGSTGQPKGVMITHRGIANRLWWMQQRYRLTPDDRVLQKTTYTFDVSVWEFFWPLIAGACLVVAQPGAHKDPSQLAAIMREQQITTAHFVPSMLQTLLAEADLSKCRSLQRVICSGEELTPQLQQEFFEVSNAELHNLYGPTEAAIDVTAWHCRSDLDVLRVPIGGPIANTTAFVLDVDMEPVPPGVLGELYIGGIQLARGYVGRPGLTAAQFVPDPHSSVPGWRLYRTGDLVRQRADGQIEFVGRADQQIKLRGIRVELGEIESAIRRHPEVRDVAVVARQGQLGETYLAGFVIPDARRAGPVWRLASLGTAGQVDSSTTVELPNAMTVVHTNRSETEFLYREIFEERVYLRHGVTVRPGDVVLDIGAHIGLFTLAVAAEATDVSLFAFEPIPQLFEILRTNVKIHGVQAKLFPCGLANVKRTEEFTYYPGAPLLSGRFADAVTEREVVASFVRNTSPKQWSEDELREVLEEALRTEKVKVTLTTVSAIMQEQGIEQVGLLKIDAEKSELDILLGIEETDWPRIEQIAAEVHDEGGRLHQVRSLLEAHGYLVSVEKDEKLGGALYRVFAISKLRATTRRPISLAKQTCPPPESPEHWKSVGSFLSDVRRAARETLPEAMMPSVLRVVPALPLGPTGKVDRKALPATAVDSVTGRPPYVAPRSPTEERLVAVWHHVLGLPEVGIRDSFFDVGGHSLLAARVIAHIRDAFGVDIPIRSIFDAPTIEQFTPILEDALLRPSETPIAITRIPRRKDLSLGSLERLSDEEAQKLLEELE